MAERIKIKDVAVSVSTGIRTRMIGRAFMPYFDPNCQGYFVKYKKAKWFSDWHYAYFTKVEAEANRVADQIRTLGYFEEGSY